MSSSLKQYGYVKQTENGTTRIYRPILVYLAHV